MLKSLKKFYLNIFKDQLFIIKAGGRVITDKKARENLINNIQELTNDGIKILLIYGGGEAIDESLKELGRTPFKIDGRRISSVDDIKIIKKTLAGDLGFKLSESLVKAKLPSTVLNAVPPHWATAKRRPPNGDTIRYDGTLNDINSDAIWDHFSATNLAICPCLAFDKEGTALNINADNVAIDLAAKTKANKLVLLTDIDGVMINGELVSVLTAREIEKLIADKIVTDGMRVKMESCIDALRSGVKRVHILNGFRKNALRDEVYTSEGIGTMIVRETEKNIYLKQEIKEQ